MAVHEYNTTYPVRAVILARADDFDVHVRFSVGFALSIGSALGRGRLLHLGAAARERFGPPPQEEAPGKGASEDGASASDKPNSADLALHCSR